MLGLWQSSQGPFYVPATDGRTPDARRERGPMDTTTTEPTEETTETTGSEPTAAEAQTAAATVPLEEHKSEVDRYRNQFGQEKKAREALEKRLQAIEDEQKPELQRLTEAAGKIPTLEAALAEKDAQIEALSGALAAEVDRQRKGLPEEIRSLLPEGLSPVDQLAWLGKAAKVKAGSNGLPPSGGRAPGAAGAPAGPSDKDRQAHARHYQTRF